MQDILDTLLTFPSIVEAKIVEKSELGWVLVELTWVVSLPRKFVKAGQSATGVYEAEQVFYCFPSDYPAHAPTISLRKDFPTDLPHINPHQLGDFVPPCVSETPLSELLHSQGLWGVIEATDEWLKNAASNELHDPAQGWEPIRRSDSSGIMVVNTDNFRSSLCKQSNQVNYFQAQYIKPSDAFSFGGINDKCLGTANTALDRIGVHPEHAHGPAIAPIIAVSILEPNEKYYAEKIVTFSDLLSFSEKFGLCEPLKHRYKYVVKKIVKSNHQHHQLVVDDFFVVLAIKRPYPIIGLNSDIELLAYRIEVKIDSLGQMLKNSPCYPVLIQDVCTAPLLKAVSGTQNEKNTKISLLGCGSLGSKLALHLAKTGNYSFQLIDKDYLSMHNNARHGLVETNIFRCHNTKAELLEETIKKLGVSASSLSKDVRKLIPAKDFSIRHKGGYIIDTTASLAVRHFLSHQLPDLPGCLIQSYLLNKSRLGIIIAEGESRNPRIDDINAMIFQLGINDARYSKDIYTLDAPQAHHFSDGCGSFTTRMTDIDISIPTALMSAQLNQFMKTHPDDYSSGWVSLASVNDDFSTHVNNQHLSKTLVFEATDKYPWEVRVLGSVSKQIHKQAHTYPRKENGGILLGQYDEFSKTIYISGLMAAPTDSKQTATRFILGTQDVEEQLVNMAKQSNGKIAFSGTWHSHPNSEPPSGLDKSTLKSLQAKTELPIVMLVHTGGRIERIIE